MYCALPVRLFTSLISRFRVLHGACIFHNIMTSTLSSAAWEIVPIPSSVALPTPTSCSPGIAPNGLNITGLTGQICQVNVPPNDVNITSCCNNGAEVRILNDCFQWCEAINGSDFFDCVNEMAPSSYPFLGGPCLVVSASSTPTMSSSSAGPASTSSTSSETPDSTDASPSPTESEEDGAEATESPDVEGMYQSHLRSYYYRLLIEQDAGTRNLAEQKLGMTVLAVAATLGILAWH